MCIRDSFCVLGFGFTPSVTPGLFCVLGSAFSHWVVAGAFCVLRSSSFSLGSCRCFGIFMSGFGGSLARLGWAAWFVRFIYLSCPADPSLSAGAGVILFARLSDFLPSRRPPHSVRGHGLGNRAAKLRHGTVGFSCWFSLSSCRRPPQLRAGGRPG